MLILQSEVTTPLDAAGGPTRVTRGTSRAPHGWRPSRIGTTLPRPRRRLKRSVRITGLAFIVLFLVGIIIRFAVPTHALLTEYGSPQSSLDRSSSDPLTPAVSAHVEGRPGPRVTLDVKPAGYLIPDDGSEDSTHAGG